MSNPILEKLRMKGNAESIEWRDLSDLEVKVEIGKANFTEILNARVEDFITFAVHNKKLYVVGFLGRNAVLRDFPIVLSGKDADKSFQFSIDRSKVKILNNKEGLQFELEKGLLTWTFQYGTGLMYQKMRPSIGFHDLTPFLNFVFHSSSGRTEGVVDSKDLKEIRKMVMGVTNDKNQHNVSIGSGYLFTILDTFAVYKRISATADILITDSILSNLPRTDENFTCLAYNNYSGLIGQQSKIHFIFKAYETDNLIEPYTDLQVEWLANLTDGVHGAIKILAFGEKIEVRIDFMHDKQAMLIQDNDNINNKFVAMTEVITDGHIVVPSYLQNFKNITKIGYVRDPSFGELPALETSNGCTCLLA